MTGGKCTKPVLPKIKKKEGKKSRGLTHNSE